MKNLRFIWFLALRNAARYKRRSLQTVAILAIGCFSIMIVDSFMKGFASNAMERVVEGAGLVDAHGRGYLESADAIPLDLAVSDARAAAKLMIDAAENAGVDRGLAAASIVAGCMVSNGEVSKSGLVVGIDPFARTADGGYGPVTPSMRRVEASLTAGSYYGSPGEGGAILDERLAAKLGVAPGDSAVIVANDAYGSFSMLETKVIAVAREGSLPDEAICAVDFGTLSEAVGMEGKASVVSLWLENRETGRLIGADEARPAIDAALEALEPDASLTARGFADIASSQSAMFEFLDVFLAGMMVIFVLVAGVGVANTILLSVRERVSDLGALRAIALSPAQSGALIFAETAILAAFAAALALAFGAIAVLVLRETGASLTFSLSDVGAGLPDAIKPELFMDRLVGIALGCSLLPLAAAALPARAASRLTVRECMSTR
jgi:putative ABC transport system permease protein